MNRLVHLVFAALLLVPAAGRAEQNHAWEVVCPIDETTGERQCYVSLFTADKDRGAWLSVAVYILEGTHEIQVTGNGKNYDIAEINAGTDTTIVTDYCNGSYCIFVNAGDIVDQFVKGSRAFVRMTDGTDRESLEERISLMGFTKAHREYLRVISR
ncbi:MAG: hypothetical protein ACE5MH_11275 [Terriglobia bacterium]